MFLKAYPRGEAPVETPGKFQVFNSFEEIPETVKEEVARTFVAIFGKEEDPWENEKWTVGEVEEKMEKELSENACSCSYLATMKGDDKVPIGGFCWGAVITPEQISQRMQAHTTSENEYLIGLQKKIKAPHIIFVDEVAVVKQFRLNTMEALQFLFRPLLEIALSERLGIICWTSPKANIYKYLLNFGFKEIATTDDIAFLYANRWVAKALAKFDQNMSFVQGQKVMSITSRLKRAKK